jgi:hypothetical protein
MIKAERYFLWGQYPEVRELFEEYNGILLEEDSGWEQLIARCHEIEKKHDGNEAVKALLLDAVEQLEKIAKKRQEGV